MIAALFAELGYWLPIRDGDPRASAMYARHYSAYQYKDHRRQLHSYRNRHLIVGPGHKLMLLGSDEQALWCWRKFIDKSGQTGINCAIFRNEGERRSSDLIREAVAIAWQRWPGQRLYTYISVNVTSGNPGYCYQKAGWSQCGRTKSGLLIFELRPPRTFVGVGTMLATIEPATLTMDEQEELLDHEAIIEQSQAVFVEVGNALMAIRDAKLYRATHTSFDAYLAERWPAISKRRGYQLIDAAAIAKEIPITNERQARALKGVPIETAKHAYQAAAQATNGAPSGKAIEQALAPQKRPQHLTEWQERAAKLGWQLDWSNGEYCLFTHDRPQGLYSSQTALIQQMIREQEVISSINSAALAQTATPAIIGASVSAPALAAEDPLAAVRRIQNKLASSFYNAVRLEDRKHLRALASDLIAALDAYDRPTPAPAADQRLAWAEAGMRALGGRLYPVPLADGEQEPTYIPLLANERYSDPTSTYAGMGIDDVLVWLATYPNAFTDALTDVRPTRWPAGITVAADTTWDDEENVARVLVDLAMAEAGDRRQLSQLSSAIEGILECVDDATYEALLKRLHAIRV